ncbi:MAG: protein kinase [Acidobacteriota bacterium]|nr:protein kinase [Acidobacteriota bacterium]
MLGKTLKCESRYKIIESLGKGSRGEVYLVEKVHLGRQYRLKMLPASVNKNGVDTELEILTRWQHPGIPRAHEYFRSGKDLYLILDHAPGETLDSKLRKRLNFDIIGFTTSFLDVLDHLHQRGYLHGDPRPEHIWCNDTGRVLITDFGYTRSLTDEKPWEAPELHPFMAPERRSGKPGGTRADLCSVGLLLQELCARDDELRKRLKAVIEKAIDSNPDRRYEQASELKYALDEAGKILEQDTDRTMRMPSSREALRRRTKDENKKEKKPKRGSIWGEVDSDESEAGIWGQDEPTQILKRPGLATLMEEAAEDIPPEETIRLEKHDQETVQLGKNTIRRLLSESE